MWRNIAAAALLLFLLAVPGHASGVTEQVAEAAGASAVTGAVPESARGATKGLDPAVSPDLNKGVDNILRETSRQVGSLLRDSLGGMVMILGIVALCGVAAVLMKDSAQEIKIVPLVGILGLAAVAGGQTHSLLSLGREAIREMDAFSKILLPSLAVAGAAAGAPTAAFAWRMATSLFCDLLITLVDRLLIPLIYAHFALITCDALVGGEMLARLAKLVKWLVTGLLTLFLTGFIFYLNVSGGIAGSADALAVKTAKFAMSGTVPVVGGILSDAAEAVLAGASIVRGALGIFGVVALIGICLTPFLRLGIQALLFKLVSALSAPLADSRLVKYLDDVGGAVSLVLAATASVAFLLMISLVSGVLAGMSLG